MKRILVALMAAFVASAVFAKVPIQQGFESASGPSDAGFVPSVGAEDDSKVVTYASAKPSNSLAPYPFAGDDADASFGSKYLSIDTGDSTLWRANSTTGNVYFDMVAQFQPVTETSVALSDDAKFAVYLDSNSNVVVVAGNGVYPATVTNANVTATKLDPGTWARVTIAATNNAFSVRINGTLVSSSGTSSFPFLKSGDISSVGFTGTGALDDFVARTTDPYFDNTLMIATIGGTSGERYASLAAAVADAGEDDVIELQSNNSESITLAEGMIFKLKCATGVEYTGTVTSYSGYRLVVSEPDANGVVTYSQSPYKPSININFTDSGNGLTTLDDVGLFGYGVPGTSWNNFAAANATYSTVNAVDSTGAASAMSGVSVTVSGTRGSYSCSSLTPSTNPLHGYIDENASNPTPTVTVTGIPYYRYRVLVYHSTDTASAPFGYDTINGVNYTYVNDVLAEGTTATTAWGASGAQDSANEIAEGGNVLLTGELSGSTLTIVGHRAGGDSSARGCIAAIQIIEVKPDVGENDLEIPVSGDTQYTVEETKELSGTVYLTGSGTLTLAGENKISAATIDVGDLVTLVVDADRLDGTTFTGGGTVVYNNALPVTGKGWTNSSAWTGTVWINGKSGVTDFNVNSYGNANSAVKLSGIEGWVSAPFDNTVPVILENGTFDYALKLTNGNSPNAQYPTRCTTFVKVSGSGTISDGNAATPMLKIYDGTEFSGTLTLTRAKVVFCSADSTTLPAAYTSIPNASIYVDIGNSATVASGMTWTADGGFIVDGTLTVDGTLASSQAAKAVSGSGTVVFNGKLPSPTGDAWWKNSDWDGIVQIAGVTDLVGGTGWTGSNFLPNDYGNSESVLELKNCSGWLPNDTNYRCTVPLKVSGKLTINNGISGNKFVISKLLGSGAIYTTSNVATVTIQVLNADDFTGYVQLNSKRVIFGETIPETFTSGQIYVGSGFSFTVPNSEAAWYGTGGILLEGVLKAAARSNFGGGTTITTTDTGVLELTSTANVNDSSYGDYPTSADLSKVTGTGTLKYSSTAGWRAFPDQDAKMPASTLTIQTELADSLIITKYNGETVIGNLAGTKNIRSDFGNNGANGRILTVTQSKDTEWQGKFVSNRITQFNVVAPATGTPGTLTLAGTQTVNIPAQINGSVNLTGTWVGNVTVAGTLGGTGSITGNLTLSDGATLIVDDVSHPLAVTGDNMGDITATGTINVKLPAGTTSFSQNIISATGTVSSSATFKVYVGGTLRSNMKVVKSVDGGLKIVTTGSIISYF